MAAQLNICWAKACWSLCISALWRLEHSGLSTDFLQQWKVTVKPLGSCNRSFLCNELQPLKCNRGDDVNSQAPSPLSHICPHNASHTLSATLIGRVTGNVIQKTQLLFQSYLVLFSLCHLDLFSLSQQQSQVMNCELKTMRPKTKVTIRDLCNSPSVHT